MSFDALTVLTVALFIGGYVLSGLAALYWSKHVVLHALPFAYAFAAEAIQNGVRDRSWQWDGPIVFGLIFYVLAWITLWGVRAEEKRHHGT